MEGRLNAPDAEMASESEADEAHEKSVAALHARLDAERMLKEKVREEERACFEETARILGHLPPSAEQAQAAARRHEMIARIAKLGEQAGFIGEAFADDPDEISVNAFGGGQIMGGGSPFGLTPFDIASNAPFPFYMSRVFRAPYRFKREYPEFSEALPKRGADRHTGRVFARGSSLGIYDGHLGASVGVRFRLPGNGPFDEPLPSYRTAQARIVASIAGTKRWLFHAESTAGLCRGDVWFFPIWAHPLYDQQESDIMGEFPTASAMRWKKRTFFPPDFNFSDPYHWSVYARNTHWPAATALPKTAVSPWFTVDNHHSYDIHVGVRVETEGHWRPGDDDRYAVAIAEMEAVIQSITVQFIG